MSTHREEAFKAKRRDLEQRAAAFASRLRLFEDQVLVLLDPRELISEGGIEKDTSGKERNLWARVLAVGPGKQVHGAFHSTRSKPGERVRLAGVRNTFIPDLDEGDAGAVLVLPEFTHVLGVLEDDDAPPSPSSAEETAS